MVILLIYKNCIVYRITLNEIFGRVNGIQNWDCVGACLSCAVLGSG